MIKRIHWLSILMATGLAVTACDNRETAMETREDVAEARQEGAGDVTDARRELAEARSENMADTAEAREDVARAQAKADYDVAIEACESMTGDTRDICKDTAKRNLEWAQNEADAARKSAEESADQMAP